jgi:L-lactate dehydrogenase
MNKPTIAIIGAGAVGTTTAYALMLKNIPVDIILIDLNEARCVGEVMDLSDVAPLCTGDTQIGAGSTADVQQADIIIIACGKRQEPGQSRTELLEANKAMLATLITQMKPFKKTAIIIMVTNPVDILTYYAQQLSGLPHSQVFGTGTFLDSLRMKELLAHKLQIHESSIHAYVIGEHGDHQIPVWSTAEIGGKPLRDFSQITPSDLHEIAEKTKNKAYEIIAGKGSTFYGIATCVAALCHTIVYDEKQIIPLSCYIPSLGIYLSMPAVLSAHGIERIIQIPLDDQEKKQLDTCAQELKKLL